MTCDRYIFWHQLLVYHCGSCLLSLFVLLSCILQFSYLSYYFSLLYLQLFLLSFMHIVSSARALSLYTHTHHGRVLTTLDLHVQILDGLFLLCRCSLRSYIMRGAWVPLCSGILISVIFLLLSWFSLYRIQLPFSCHYSSAIIVIVMDMYYCSDWWLL